MKATNKPELIRYYEIKTDHILIHGLNGVGISKEFNTNLAEVRKAYAPLKLRKLRS